MIIYIQSAEQTNLKICKLTVQANYILCSGVVPNSPAYFRLEY